MTDSLSKIPLLRFLLPLILGILISCTQLPYYIAIGLLVFGIILYVATYSKKDFFIQYRINYRYYISLFCIIISLAWINTLLLSTNEIEIKNYQNSTAIAIIDEIKDNDNSMNITASILNHIDTVGNITDEQQFKVKLNIEGVNYRLNVGDIICFNADYKSLRNMNNPDEFDYVTFMARKGILYTQHLKNNDYEIVGEKKSIIVYAKNAQNFLINRILTSDISPSTQEFLITILLGDKNMIDDHVKTEFSKSGLAHILALSGLHIAIITLILSFILYPLNWVRLRNLRLIITLAIIIVYSFITGLSPSVVRATIMTAFFIVSYILYRENSSLNALCGAAIFILVISPMEIFSVGFQLSFLAVASIIIFSNTFNHILPKNAIGYYISSLLLVSVSATVGTAIISAYYFHIFPTFFIIGNSIIIPLLPIILGVAILYVIFPIPIIGTFLDFSYSSLEKFITAINDIPFSSIIDININLYDIILFYLLIAILLCAVNLKYRNKSILALLATLILWSSIDTIFPRSTAEKGFVVFNDYKQTPILFYENSKGYLLFSTEQDAIENFKKNNSKFLIKRGVNTIYNVIDSINIGRNIYISNPYINIDGKRIAVITNKKIRKVANGNKIKLDYLVITKNYYGKIAKLIDIYNPTLVVLSGNIYDNREATLIKECELLGLKYLSIAQSGALYIKL